MSRHDTAVRHHLAGTGVTPAEHVPVLRDAALEALSVRADGIYVDATFGRGGHSRAILDVLGPAGRLIAFDQDPSAAVAATNLADDGRFTFVAASFADLAAELGALGLAGHINGILFDLGVSSPQFDLAERGFSFRFAGPLDMRMNTRQGVTLGAWLADAKHGEIASVIKRLGEEPMAGRIAAHIIAARDRGELSDTAQLAAVVSNAVPAAISQGKRVHPATRTFQALRMHINDELGALDAGLAAALDIMAPDARLAVISFHSLEDRRVKRFMRAQAQPEQPALPMAARIPPALSLVGKPVRADEFERAANARSRSAIMRIAERTAAPVIRS